MPRRPDVPCSECGRLLWSGSTSLPAGKRRCQVCRRANPPPPRLRTIKLCRDCGGELGAARNGGPQRCGVCWSDRRRAADRRKNIKRRGADVGETFTLAEVGIRDRWRCHLCGAGVDSLLSGMDPFGPTIDHLVPVSHGGQDVRSNVALAHRSCNTRRQTGGTVQLRLVG